MDFSVSDWVAVFGSFKDLSISTTDLAPYPPIEDLGGIRLGVALMLFLSSSSSFFFFSEILGQCISFTYFA